MNTKTPAIAFLVLGIIFVVFSEHILVAMRWLDKKIWTEKRRTQFPGHGGTSTNYKPWMVIVLGISWIVSAILIWLISK